LSDIIRIMDDIHKATMAKLTHAYLIILFLFYNKQFPPKEGRQSYTPTHILCERFSPAIVRKN